MTLSLKHVLVWPLALLALSAAATAPAHAQDAEAQDPAPVVQMGDQMHDLLVHMLWESVDKQGLSEHARVEAELMARQYARYRSNGWRAQGVVAREGVFEPGQLRGLGNYYTRTYADQDQPLYMLMALQFRHSFRDDPIRTSADPDTLRPLVNSIVEGDYSDFVKAYALSVLRSAILVRYRHREDGWQEAQQLDDLHESILDYVQAIATEGIEGLPESVDEPALLEAFLHMIENDYASWPDPRDAYFLLYDRMQRSLDIDEMAYPWIGEMIRGIAHLEIYYWVHWGRGELKDGRYAGRTLREHLDMARESLEAAWERHQDRPHACFHLMRLHWSDRDEFERWFQAGHDVNGLVIPAMYRIYREHTEPQRGVGEIGPVMQYAYDMVDSGRFDTPIPEQFYWTITIQHGRFNRTDYRQHERFFEYLTRYCEGRSAAEDDARGEAYWRSAIAIGALFTGNAEQGMQMIADLGDQFDISAARESAVWQNELTERLNELGHGSPQEGEGQE